MTDNKKKTTKKIEVNTPEDAFNYLESIAECEDKDINILEAGIALGMIFLPGMRMDKYHNFVKKLEKELKELFKENLSKKGAEDNLALRISTLVEIVYTKHEFRGDRENFDDIDNINFVRLLETRTGIPVSMGLLIQHLAESMKWECSGINFPGHFLLKFTLGAETVIADPFENCKKMEAHDLRELLKSILGENAELSHEFYEPMKKKDALLRLQNNLKARLIDAEDYPQALLAAESIEAFYPEEYRIYLDKGVLYAKLHSFEKSAEALEKYISMTPDINEKSQASALLEQIRMTIL